MRRHFLKIVVWALCGAALAVCWWPLRAGAQAAGSARTKSEVSSGQNGDADSDVETIFSHTLTGRYWVSGQANVVLQGYGAFKAEYSGPNSLTNWAQSTTTHLLTLYTGYELSQTTEVFADIEDATGNGVGNAGGLAGYVNLDVVRLISGVPRANEPYVAQFMLREIIPLTSKRVPSPDPRDELHLATMVPARRIEVRLGKMDLTNFF